MLNCLTPAKLITPKEMDHNKFDAFKDIIFNMRDFFNVFVEEPLEESNNSQSSTHRGFERTKNILYFNPDVVEFPEFMFDYPYVSL